MAQPAIRLTKAKAADCKDCITSEALARHCPLDASANDPHALDVDLATAPDLGELSRLPIELQLQILGVLDAQSVLVFRRVNRRAMYLVNSMVEWKIVMSLAPSTIRMSIGLHTLHKFSLTDIVAVLHIGRCITCNGPASAIDMIDLIRTCHLCVQRWSNIIPGLLGKPSDAMWHHNDRINYYIDKEYGKITPRD